MNPRPPASETAAASSGVDAPPASGAPTTGICIHCPNASVFMVLDERRSEPTSTDVGGTAAITGGVTNGVRRGNLTPTSHQSAMGVTVKAAKRKKLKKS